MCCEYVQRKLILKLPCRLISAQYLPQPISETMEAGSSNRSVKDKFLDILPSKVEERGLNARRS
jgi:hypothetical protein